MARPTLKSAVEFINQHGALLVFPIKSDLKVPSLWKCFHPRTTMQWDWSADGTDRVPELWHLREELSRCRKVVYVKWYQGRATFFSLEVFTALLSTVLSRPDPLAGLDQSALKIYRTLQDDSPLPTRALRELSDLRGKEHESEFQRSQKKLWQRLLIVGYGEIEEGGFPSLAVGSTQLLFEEQWDRAKAMSSTGRDQLLQQSFTADSPFIKAYRRMTLSFPPEVAQTRN